MYNKGAKQITSQHILRGLIVALIFIGASTFTLTYQLSPNPVINLEAGGVASEDIFAPEHISYISEIETAARQDRARKGVATVYTAPNPQIARQQVARLRQIFDYLDTVRADPYGSQAEKIEWITAIPDLSLSDSVIDQILIMNDQAWAETKQEALAILDQMMRTEIRENQVLTIRRQLPTQVALDTPDEQANVIVAITEDMIKPNTFPDEERTEAERQAASEAVEPVEITYEENELVIPAGQIISAEEMEAIQALTLETPQFSWLQDVVVPGILILIITVFLGVYVIQHIPRVLIDERCLILVAVLSLTFIIIARFMVSTNPLIAYLYPIAALAMLIVILIDVNLAFILTTVMAFLAGYIANNIPPGIIVYLVMSGWTGILAIKKGQRVNGLLWAGAYVGLVNTGTILVFNLPESSADFGSVGVLMLAGLLNVIISAGLTLIGLLAIGSLMGITTSIQLQELERPTQPLLRQLLRKAPGTYHHSLMVGNLAEQAAERIGANALLVRVMAYYHDVGKMQRPYFFIENQPSGVNVHEKLDPQISAQIIISHVKDGLDLANKYRLPLAIKAGIAQHQGTGLVKYFYYQALKQAEEKEQQIDEASFRYPGPKPQNKENGILMLADVSESSVRALQPASAEEIDGIVQKVISDKLTSGELDECDLTIADLYEIRKAFVDILQGVHHPRIKYPEQIQSEVKEQEPEAPPQEEPEAAEETTVEAEDDENSSVPVVTPTPLQSLVETDPASGSVVRQE